MHISGEGRVGRVANESFKTCLYFSLDKNEAFGSQRSLKSFSHVFVSQNFQNCVILEMGG